MGLNDGPRDRKSQAGPVRLGLRPGFVGPEKAVEKTRQQFGADLDTGVFDRERDLLARGLDLDLDLAIDPTKPTIREPEKLEL